MVPDKAFGLNGTANLVDVTRCGKEFDGTTVILAFHNRKTFGSNKPFRDNKIRLVFGNFP
jgi:hypothetical protein